jgi:large subunit ribosomal protein L7Ae
MSKALEIIEVANKTGKIKKGVNEVTKAVERGTAKIVIIAKDVNPPEITMHLPLLCKDKGIKCLEVPTRAELGAAAGLPIPTVAIAVINEGDAKDLIKQAKSE